MDLSEQRVQIAKTMCACVIASLIGGFTATTIMLTVISGQSLVSLGIVWMSMYFIIGVALCMIIVIAKKKFLVMTAVIAVLLLSIGGTWSMIRVTHTVEGENYVIVSRTGEIVRDETDSENIGKINPWNEVVVYWPESIEHSFQLWSFASQFDMTIELTGPTVILQVEYFSVKNVRDAIEGAIRETTNMLISQGYFNNSLTATECGVILLRHLPDMPGITWPKDFDKIEKGKKVDIPSMPQDSPLEPVPEEKKPKVDKQGA